MQLEPEWTNLNPLNYNKTSIFKEIKTKNERDEK